MVMRYFGSKRGLFAAASAIDLRLAATGNVSHDRLGEALVEHFLNRWEGADGAPLQVLLRAATSNQSAAAKMRGIFADQVLTFITDARNGAESSRQAVLVSTQMLGLAYCRYVLRLPPLMAMPRHALVHAVGATIQRYIGLPNDAQP
jgi:AcrR family transcriptional regulator